jgi:predicted DsbA family dithiol-disulfide isomerase
MHRIVIRIAKVLAAAVLSVGALACSEKPRSAAADVPGEDMRRLPPDRAGTLPDIMMVKADRGRSLGSDSAKITMLVISDYQCAACRTWFSSTLPLLRREYVDRGTVRLVWSHYPLRTHAAAVQAASAALCASAQGKFWEASEQLFAAAALRDSTFGRASVIDSAARVPGVDPFTFARCVESKRMLRQVRLDIDWVDTNRVGTPLTFFVAGRKLPGTTSVPALRAILDSLVERH